MKILLMAQIFLFSVVFATASYGEDEQNADAEDLLEEVIVEGSRDIAKPKPAPTTEAVKRKSGITRDADAAEKAEIVRSNSATGAHVDDPVVRDHRTTKADPVVRDHRNESPEDAAAQTNTHVQRIGGKLGETHPRDNRIEVGDYQRSGNAAKISGQQGRIHLDSDWNEAEEQATRDTVETEIKTRENLGDQIVAPNNRSGTTQEHRTARTSENETSFDEADATFGRRTSLAAADETGDQRTITDEEKARIDKPTEAHRVTTTDRPAPLSPKPTKKTAPGDFPDSYSNPSPPAGPIPIPYPNIPSSTDGSAEKKKTP